MEDDIYKEITQIKQELSSIRTDINWIRDLLNKLDGKMQELSEAIAMQKNYTNKTTSEVREDLLKKISEIEKELNEVKEFTVGVKTSIKVVYAIVSGLIAIISILVMGG